MFLLLTLGVQTFCISPVKLRTCSRSALKLYFDTLKFLSFDVQIPPVFFVSATIKLLKEAFAPNVTQIMKFSTNNVKSYAGMAFSTSENNVMMVTQFQVTAALQVVRLSLVSFAQGFNQLAFLNVGIGF